MGSGAELLRISVGHGLTLDRFQEGEELVAAYVGPARIGRAGVAEGLPAAVGRLRGSPAHAEGDSLIGQQVQRRRLFGQIQRVLVAHVDDPGPHFDPAGAGGDSGQQGHRRRSLAGEVMYPQVGAVDSDLVGAPGDLDCVVQHLGRVWAMPDAVVSEAEESECLHTPPNIIESSTIPWGPGGSSVSVA